MRSHTAQSPDVSSMGPLRIPDPSTVQGTAPVSSSAGSRPTLWPAELIVRMEWMSFTNDVKNGEITVTTHVPPTPVRRNPTQGYGSRGLALCQALPPVCPKHHGCGLLHFKQWGPETRGGRTELQRLPATKKAEWRFLLFPSLDKLRISLADEERGKTMP